MVMSWGCINTNSTTILDKTVDKIAYMGGIFSKLRSRPIEYSVCFLWEYTTLSFLHNVVSTRENTFDYTSKGLT